jgi:hypothetical protein
VEVTVTPAISAAAGKGVAKVVHGGACSSRRDAPAVREDHLVRDGAAWPSDSCATAHPGDTLFVVAAAPTILVPFQRERNAIATGVRASLIISSLQSLRSHGHFDRYASLLEPRFGDLLTLSTAGVWLAVPLAMAHYRACDALQLPLRDQVELGRGVADRVQGPWLNVLAKGVRGAGVTPWAVLKQMPRLWDRVYQGGTGACVRQLGPKEAEVELAGLPMLGVPYFRNAYRGAFLAGLEPTCSKLYVNESGVMLDTAATYRLSWA